MTKRVLTKSIYLKATPAQVWAYLTEPEKLAKWFHKPNTPLTDGDYEMRSAETGDRFMWGTVLSAKPFETLEYTFIITPLADTPTTVRWTLQDVPGGTHLSLRHEGVPDGADAFDLTLAMDAGWDEHLGRLRGDIHDT
ncbi:SRPBCC family protein [Marivita hallyeonensis]|uniref:Uncharacterized conserved protein YndB, AHSA1/START domain n=1 Tax=Marivita hallyeonensis TaxID=996342 RepID=A0A1M5WB71_9RHOB|nr:SRPBCC domain-containing protein [Marivita hallyeonensis]SHH84839.1 Uncharacterized conserved protein YndB, AHSA1/START domain [Marivita hallyeonensis]